MMPAARAGRFGRAALPGLLITLAGCAAMPPPVAAPTLSGRLALTVDAHDDRPAQSFSANFEFAGGASRGELRLWTALGTTIAAARWAPGEAVLVTPDGERRFAGLDELSLDAFGQTLPLGAWPDWLHGRPWPGAPSRPRGEGPGFEQLGWVVDTAGADDGRVDAWRSGPPAVRLRARVDRPS